jgi:hypothetical protein
MKDPQLHFFAKLGRIITPHQKRPEPVLWFRELRILRKLEPGEKNEVRRVELRRGLNVIWAPPEEGDEPELYGDGLSGHASGKTLFCRVLRYLLGESNYGPKALRDSVETKFDHELWAVAEVFVDTQLWLVARPLAGTARRFACEGVTMDELLAGNVAHGDYSLFTDAVEAAACGPVLEEAEGGEQFGWRYLLPWLARDQECRFAGLTEWRSSLAESENPQTSAYEQQELMKAVIGLIKAEEIRLRTKLHTAEETIKKATAELPSLTRSEKRDYNKLVESLNRAGMKDFTGLESIADLRERRRLRAEGLRMALEKAEQDEKLVAAKDSWDKAVSARTTVDGRVAQATQTLETTTKAVAERTSRHQRLKASGVSNPARMEEGMCPHTIDYAVNITKCVKPPPGSSLETVLNLGDILAEADDLERLKKAHEQQLAELKTEQERLGKSVATTRAAYEVERKRVTDETTEQREWLRQLNGTSILFESAEESASAAAIEREALEDANKTRDEIKGTVEELRRDHEATEKRFSDAFADAVRAAMGGKVEPSVTPTDRGFTLSVKRKGELSGAALETIKILAFDLAAMVLSVEGAGYHPRFLIHDGPREADMARLIYERFFLYARKLEQSFDDTDVASFQYIITTTTPPPKDMQREDEWLRMKLNTAQTSERFLREDL